MPVFGGTSKFRVQVRAYRDGMHQRFSSRSGERQRLIDLALNEAEALAWQTPFPHLVFATLAEEKARAAAQWRVRQEAIFRRETEHALAI